MQEILTVDDFEAKLKTTNIPVLIDFFAVWCGPCKKLAPLVEELATQYQEKMVAYKVDIDKIGELAEKFGVQSIPTLILFKNEKQVGKQIGGLSKADLKKWVDSLL